MASKTVLKKDSSQCDCLVSAINAPIFSSDQNWVAVGNHSETSWANISALTLSDGTGENIRSNPTYIPFWFLDAGDSNTKKYGFMTVDSYVTGSGAAAVLGLDILNLAYENSGTPIQMGTVPEPAMLALAGLGGLGMLLFGCRK
jgi:hypothetical protein